MKFYIIGNCQQSPITSILRSNGIDVEMAKKPIHQLNFTDAKVIRERVKQVDIVVLQYNTGQHYLDIGVNPSSIHQLNSNTIIIPNIHYTSYHPTFSTVSSTDLSTEGLPSLLEKNCLGPHFDSLALYAYDKEIPLKTLTDFLNKNNHKLYVKNNFNNGLRERELKCDIPILDYIETNQQDKTLFYSFNHPTNDVLKELCQRIINHVGIDQVINSRIKPYLSNYRLPIYPTLSSSLNVCSNPEWPFGGGPLDHDMKISINSYDHLARTIDWISSLDSNLKSILDKYRKNQAYSRCDILLNEYFF